MSSSDDRKSVCRTLPLLLWVALLTSVCFSAEPVRYRLAFEKPNTHFFDITIHAEGLDGRSARFALPYWAPGVYIAEEFAANVQGFSATDATGKELRWQKVDDEETWQIELNGATSVSVRYRFYANGMPFRGAQYDERHASLTGAAVWMYLVNGKDRPAELSIERADGSSHAGPGSVSCVQAQQDGESQRNADGNQPQHAWTALSLDVRWELGDHARFDSCLTNGRRSCRGTVATVCLQFFRLTERYRSEYQLFCILHTISPLRWSRVSGVVSKRLHVVLRGTRPSSKWPLMPTPKRN
jgi:hypothetical protein